MEDMRYVVDLLTRINACRKNTQDISSYFIEGKYSLWAFQQYFFVSQIKEFSKTRNFDTYMKKRTPRNSAVSHFATFFFECAVGFATVVGVVSVLFRKIEIVTFSSDFLNADKKPAPRLRNIYNYFFEKKVRYIEILHITTPRAFFKNLPKRNHCGVYFESFSMVARIWSRARAKHQQQMWSEGFDYSAFSGDELRLVSLLVGEAAARIEEFKISTLLFQKFFTLTGAKAFVSVDDFRYVPQLMLACERVGITTHVFQHSNFGFLPGMYLLPDSHYNFPTVFYTWNKYWERRVKEVSSYFNYYGSRIRVGGRSFSPLQPPVILRPEPSTVKESIKVLIPYEVSLRSDYIMPFTDRMLADERITILFVLRGTIDQIDHTMQVNQYVSPKHRGNQRFVIVDPMDREKAIRSCDVIAGVYSGFLDESVETGVPICIFDTPFVNVNRLDADGLAARIDLQQDMFEQFVAAYRTPNAELTERHRRVVEGTIPIAETLKNIAGR